MPIVMIILFIIGVAIGTQAPLWLQGVLLVAFIIYMNSDKVSRMEIGAILPFVFGLSFFVGIIIGDISFLIQTDAEPLKGIPNPFTVEK